MSRPSYVIGAELGDLAVTWLDDLGNVVDFAGTTAANTYTYSLKIGNRGSASLTTAKTNGFTGAATAPNLTVAWATTGDLNGITTQGTYTLQITATNTATGKARILQGDIQILAAVA